MDIMDFQINTQTFTYQTGRNAGKLGFIVRATHTDLEKKEVDEAVIFAVLEDQPQYIQDGVRKLEWSTRTNARGFVETKQGKRWTASIDKGLFTDQLAERDDNNEYHPGFEFMPMSPTDDSTDIIIDSLIEQAEALGIEIPAEYKVTA